jgi:GDPmannose 4,6-dehydratase
MGNIDAKRDWGYAGDYIEAMWLMLQQKEPEDFVIATGAATTVRDFISLAFAEAGIPLEWQGKGIDEKGIDRNTGKTLVEIDPRYFRPAEVDVLIGDASKAREKLGWKPKTGLSSLITMMVTSDMELAKKELHLVQGGFKTKNYYE